MERHRELRIERYWERLEESFRRHAAICSALGKLGGALEKTPELQGEAFDKAVQMVDMLPDALLIRAIAEESLALGEQITWEAHLIENSSELARLAERARVEAFLQKAKSEVESRKPWFEQTCAQMNNIIRLTMDAADVVEGLGRNLQELERERKKKNPT